MNAKIIDGKAVAQRIRSECAERVRLLKDRNGIAPGLAVVLVGDDPASRVYVNNKIKACESVGIRSFNFRFPYEAETAMIPTCTAFWSNFRCRRTSIAAR